jgi:hypothetical protein
MGRRPGLSIGGPDEVEGSPDLISPGMSVGPSREHRQDRRRRAAVAVAAAVAGGVGVGASVLGGGRGRNGGRTLVTDSGWQLLVTEMKRTRLERPTDRQRPSMESNPHHSGRRGAKGEAALDWRAAGSMPFAAAAWRAMLAGFTRCRHQGFLDSGGGTSELWGEGLRRHPRLSSLNSLRHSTAPCPLTLRFALPSSSRVLGPHFRLSLSPCFLSLLAPRLLSPPSFARLAAFTPGRHSLLHCITAFTRPSRPVWSARRTFFAIGPCFPRQPKPTVALFHLPSPACAIVVTITVTATPAHNPRPIPI